MVVIVLNMFILVQDMVGIDVVEVEAILGVTDDVNGVMDVNVLTLLCGQITGSCMLLVDVLRVPVIVVINAVEIVYVRVVQIVCLELFVDDAVVDY